MENLHIVFWLLKDLSWCMLWKPIGIAMIFPTLYFAITITYRNRKIISELCHNIAVALWISANAYWMLTEFAGLDEKIFINTYTYKHLTIIPFALGTLPLIYFYLIRNKKGDE